MTKRFFSHGKSIRSSWEPSLTGGFCSEEEIAHDLWVEKELRITAAEPTSVSWHNGYPPDTPASANSYPRPAVDWMGPCPGLFVVAGVWPRKSQGHRGRTRIPTSRYSCLSRSSHLSARSTRRLYHVPSFPNIPSHDHPQHTARRAGSKESPTDFANKDQGRVSPADDVVCVISSGRRVCLGFGPLLLHPRSRTLGIYVCRDGDCMAHVGLDSLSQPTRIRVASLVPLCTPVDQLCYCG